MCKKINKYEGLNDGEYLNIYSGNFSKQIKVFRRRQQNFETRDSYLNKKEKDTKTKTKQKTIPSLIYNNNSYSVYLNVVSQIYTIANNNLTDCVFM